MKPNNVLQEEEDPNWSQNWCEATKAQSESEHEQYQDQALERLTGEPLDPGGALVPADGAQGVTDEGLQEGEMENRLFSCPIERLSLQEEECLQIGAGESLMKVAAEEKFKSFKAIQGATNSCKNV
ncbi:hypothetical protein V5O48_008872 [Marasmius crinis-equi]|uniref:Uncharacterized protein n=1 Tax=Marasmius crinis-equi TaxID=585013 RepID=A0ABR3FCQ4_9AGAR